jgi:hypothetical protein
MKILPCILLAAALLAPGIPFLAAQNATSPPSSTSPAPAHRIVFYAAAHDADYTQLEPERLFVALAVAPDPAAQIAYLQTIVPAAKATDDRGNSLAPTSPLPLLSQDRLSNLRSNFSLSDLAPDARLVAVILQVPPLEVQLGRTIKTLEGTIPAQTPSKTEPFSIPIPGKSSHTFAGHIAASFNATIDQYKICSISVS